MLSTTSVAIITTLAVMILIPILIGILSQKVMMGVFAAEILLMLYFLFTRVEAIGTLVFALLIAAGKLVGMMI